MTYYPEVFNVNEISRYLHFAPPDGSTGMTIVTGIIGTNLIGTEPDWTRDDATFLIGPTFLTEAGQDAPIYDASTVLVYPATMETNVNGPVDRWVGWGVDSSMSLLDPTGQVRVTASTVVKSPISIIVRAGFQLTVFWHGDYPGLNLRRISYLGDIRPLFRQVDVDAMKMALGLDLSSYADVKATAPLIYRDVAAGTMPCFEIGGQWPDSWVALFKEWMDSGMNP